MNQVFTERQLMEKVTYINRKMITAFVEIIEMIMVGSVANVWYQFVYLGEILLNN